MSNNVSCLSTEGNVLRGYTQEVAFFHEKRVKIRFATEDSLVSRPPSDSPALFCDVAGPINCTLSYALDKRRIFYVDVRSIKHIVSTY